MRIEDTVAFIFSHVSIFANIATIIAVIYAIGGYYQVKRHWELKNLEELTRLYISHRTICREAFKLYAEKQYFNSTIDLLKTTHGNQANVSNYYKKERNVSDKFQKALVEVNLSSSKLNEQAVVLSNSKIQYSKYLKSDFLNAATKEIFDAITTQSRSKQESLAGGLESPFKLGVKWSKLDDAMKYLDG